MTIPISTCADTPAGQKRQAILVVGMHRSGTSAITRTLNLLGAALPSALIPAKADNPAGFWESADLLQIHEDFLRSVGSAWDDPLPLAASVFHTPAAITCHDEILSVLHRDFTHTPCFIIKDPRICRLLPLWRSVLTSFNALPIAVLPLRNPLATAMSLNLRNKIPREHALAQWLAHIIQAEQGTRGWRRCFVDYDACLADPAAQVRRLVSILGCFTDGNLAAAQSAIENFWSSTLRHHHFASPQPDDESLPSWVRNVYAWAAHATRCNDDVDPAPIAKLADDIAEAARLYGPFVQSALAQQQSINALETEAAALRATLSEASVKHTSAVTTNQRLLEVVHISAQEITVLHTSQAVAYSQQQALLAENQHLRELAHTSAQELATLQASLSIACAERQALLTENQGLMDSARITSQENSALSQQNIQLTHNLTQTQTQQTRLSGALEEAHAHLATLQDALILSRNEQLQLKSAWQQANSQLKAAQAECNTVKTTLAETLQALEDVQSERDHLQVVLLQTTRIQAQYQSEQEALRNTLTEHLQHTETALTALSSLFTETLGEVTPGHRVGGLLRAAWRGRLRQRLREDADIQLIAHAGVFDASYYLHRYPDVAAAQTDPLVHYVRHGASEGRDPNPLFDSRYYWSAYPDVARSRTNPLAHYIRFGAREGRRTHHAHTGQSPLPGISALLAARLTGGASFAKQPSPAALESPPTASTTLPQGAFGWLDENNRSILAELLTRYGLTDRDTPPPGWSAEAAAARLGQLLMRLPRGAAKLSIVIPIHNQLRHTLACLESIALWPSTQPIEILIGDDASSDGSERLLPALPHLKFIRNERAEGFLDNCNRTAKHTHGRYLLLLNNDTIILPGALDALLETFEHHPDCGLAGSRLLNLDGSLQEAGGIVWADGSGWNFGRGDQPEKAEYSYLRDADYCSGAAIALPLAVWRKLGGFDSRYRPAYYEDTDLAFRVREAGLRVLYQPDAHVIHCEGISNGTSEASGLKQHQRENRPRFAACWRSRLATHGLPDARPAHFAERTRRGRALVLDTTPPTPDRDSGSQDTQILLKLLRKQGWHVTFLPENLLNHLPYTTVLRHEGIECPCYPLVDDFMTAAAHYAATSDIIIVSRQPLASKVVSPLKKIAPHAKLIFNTVDLHFLREEREAALFVDKQAAAHAADTRKAELAAIQASDATLVVSTYESDMLARLTPTARVCVMPVRREMPAVSPADFGQRKGILFIGGFRHPPNQDAVRWLLSEIWPRVRAAGLRAPLFIAGADVPMFLQDDPDNDIHVLGHVPRLADAFSSVRLSVAPIRYGAGLKGKVIDSLLHGVPTVASPMAIEGSGLEHERHLLKAETPEDFAAAIVRLHETPSLWQQLAASGLSAGQALFSDDHADQALRGLLADLSFSWCLGNNDKT